MKLEWLLGIIKSHRRRWKSEFCGGEEEFWDRYVFFSFADSEDEDWLNAFRVFFFDQGIQQACLGFLDYSEDESYKSMPITCQDSYYRPWYYKTWFPSIK